MQAVEGGSSDSAGMGDAFEQHTRHMMPAHAEFLAHWLRLVDLEEGDLTARRAEIWALPGEPGLQTPAHGTHALLAQRVRLNWMA